jgi:hypothetical protein
VHRPHRSLVEFGSIESIHTNQVVTAAHDYDDLHNLVDRLTPDQAHALRAVALQLVVVEPAESRAVLEPAGERRRRLSFAGLMHAEADLAARSAEIFREEHGKQAEFRLLPD